MKFSEIVIDIAQKAGDAIIDIYNDPTTSSVKEFKSDDSPLTLADKASHEVIMEGLESLDEKWPILSEEGADIPFEERKNWEQYWLVDPLDGTKEFINRNGEFTVNIALINQGIPVWGVVYVPVTGVTYVGELNQGAFKLEGGVKSNLKVNHQKEGKKIAVRSKSHANPEEETVLARYEATEFISVGSSLKFCMLAEGKADVYYRHGPTMEWDTAAGQAVLLGAGGRIYQGNTEEKPLAYNKEILRNPSFLCLGF